MDTSKIFGPPGTGKTTRLVQIVLKELENVPPDRIAYLTHTTAARDEAISRVEKELPETKGKLFNFRTIHSACCEALSITRSEIWGWKDNEGLSETTGFLLKGGFDPEDMLDYNPDSERTYDLILHAKGVASHRMITLKEQIALMPDHEVLSPETVKRFLTAYEEYKTAIGKRDFIDMLEDVDQGFKPLDVDVVIIDEAQDLSKRQWKVAHMLGDGAKRWYIAGDDDQAIYAFIGADEFGFLDHPATRRQVLRTSYRCAAHIGSVADQVISQISRREPKHTLWREGEATIQNFNDDDSYLPWDEWAGGSESVMVLCRHKKQVRDVRKLLYGLGVPHTVKGAAPNTSKDAIKLKAFFLLRRGDSVPARDAAHLYTMLGMKDMANAMRDRAHRMKGLLVKREDVHLDWNMDWVKIFGKTNKQRWEFEALQRMLKKYNVPVIGQVPNIDISTYHGSKGREADRTVLFTDCYKSVWDEQEVRPEGEIRLAYVGLTRAKSSITVVTPRTRQYMRALVERGTK